MMMASTTLEVSKFSSPAILMEEIILEALLMGPQCGIKVLRWGLRIKSLLHKNKLSAIRFNYSEAAGMSTQAKK